MTDDFDIMLYLCYSTAMVNKLFDRMNSESKSMITITNGCSMSIDLRLKRIDCLGPTKSLSPSLLMCVLNISLTIHCKT